MKPRSKTAIHRIFVSDKALDAFNDETQKWSIRRGADWPRVESWVVSRKDDLSKTMELTDYRQALKYMDTCSLRSAIVAAIRADKK